MTTTTTILRLCELQRQLDHRIIKEKNIRISKEDQLANTQVALLIELAEFANNGRWFKIWSKDQKPKSSVMTIAVDRDGLPYPVEKNPLLEEYVDCLHFFLSLANESDNRSALGFNELTLSDRYGLNDRKKLNISFLNVHYELSRFAITKSPVDFAAAWMNFLTMGLAGFGFTWSEIVEAYYEKNSVNHVRQDTGY